MRILFIIYLIGVLYNIIALWKAKTDELGNLLIVLLTIAFSWVSTLTVLILKWLKKL